MSFYNKEKTYLVTQKFTFHENVLYVTGTEEL